MRCTLYSEQPCTNPATRRIETIVDGRVYDEIRPQPFCDEHGPSINDETGREYSHVGSALPVKTERIELRVHPL